MNKLIKDLNIDETYTKKIQKPIFDSVKQNTFPQHGYNYMADLLFLPETTKKFKYLLCIVDLWSDEFDIEPLKTKESNEVLGAMKKIFTRSYIKEPKASIRTDGGTEFKGVFHKYLYDHSILHREAIPHRHQQLANVEKLNYILGRLFNGYMNTKEIETGKVYTNWTDIIDIVRKRLNKIRKKPDGNPYTNLMSSPIDTNAKFKINDLVYRKLEIPYNALGHKQDTTKFRVGDYRWDIKNPRKIKSILYYPNNIRYILNELPNVSYAETELMKANEKNETYTVKQIIGKKIENHKTFYKVWWNGYKKSNSTWEEEQKLLEDGLKEIIDEFNDTN